jgi:hypothetical protein
MTATEARELTCVCTHVATVHTVAFGCGVEGCSCWMYQPVASHPKLVRVDPDDADCSFPCYATRGD